MVLPLPEVHPGQALRPAQLLEQGFCLPPASRVVGQQSIIRLVRLLDRLPVCVKGRIAQEHTDQFHCHQEQAQKRHPCGSAWVPRPVPGTQPAPGLALPGPDSYVAAFVSLHPPHQGSVHTFEAGGHQHPQKHRQDAANLPGQHQRPVQEEGNTLQSLGHAKGDCNAQYIPQNETPNGDIDTLPGQERKDLPLGRAHAFQQRQLFGPPAELREKDLEHGAHGNDHNLADHGRSLGLGLAPFRQPAGRGLVGAAFIQGERYHAIFQLLKWNRPGPVINRHLGLPITDLGGQHQIRKPPILQPGGAVAELPLEHRPVQVDLFFVKIAFPSNPFQPNRIIPIGNQLQASQGDSIQRRVRFLHLLQLPLCNLPVSLLHLVAIVGFPRITVHRAVIRIHRHLPHQGNPHLPDLPIQAGKGAIAPEE